MADDRLDIDNNNEEEEKPYWNIIVNEFDTENINASQMEQWSILSNVITMYSMTGILEIFII